MSNEPTADLIIHVIPPTEEVPKPCVQCDATIRAADKAGLVRGVDYIVLNLDDASRDKFKGQGLISSPVVVSNILDDQVGGFRPDFIKLHVAERASRIKRAEEAAAVAEANAA